MDCLQAEDLTEYLSCECESIPEIEDDGSDDERFFSAEMDDSMIVHTTDDELTIPADNPQYNTCEYGKIKNESENDITSLADLSAGYNAIADPQEPDSLCESSLKPRNTNTIQAGRTEDDQEWQ